MALSREEARSVGKEAADKILKSLTFETPEQLKEADTDYLRRHGVKRVGWRKVFKAEETEKDIEICGGDATRYYFDDKEPEELPSARACVTVPKEFFSQLKTAFDPPRVNVRYAGGWTYAKVGQTEMRGKKTLDGIEFEQVSPTYDPDDLQKAVDTITAMFRKPPGETAGGGKNPGRTQKMRGVIAELKTFNAKGEVVDSEIVFEPVCDWYISKLQDYLACTKYTDIGTVIDEFGIDVAERIKKGEVITVDRELSEQELAEKGLRQTSCTEPLTIEKIESPIVYPYKGGRKEYLIRRWE